MRSTTKYLWLSTIYGVTLPGCGPSGPGQAEAGETEATSQASDATESVPTGDAPSAADCGPCATLEAGDVAPSGAAQIDGFIVASAELHLTTFDLQRRFAADMLDLGDLYGLPDGEVDVSYVAGLTAAITADLAANTDGGVRVEYTPSVCAAGVDVAVEAQRSCEFDAGCDPGPALERPPVQCEGTCLGDCAGACSGPGSCAVATAASPCEGTCAGACTLLAPAACTGVCRGDCLGVCALIDAGGACAGSCNGQCAGTCVTQTPQTCDGVCSGVCRVEQGSAQCSVAARCAGACDSGCAGECVGAATPPSFAASCAASTSCQPQAAAQGLVGLRCTPPALQLRFTLALQSDRPAFTARIQALEWRAPGILQDAARLRALIDGAVDGAPAFVPSPTASLSASLASLLAAGLDLDALGVAAGRRECVAPALQVAAKQLAADAAASQATLAAQALFVQFVTSDL